MSDLAEFLLARIAEDEDAARSVPEPDPTTRRVSLAAYLRREPDWEPSIEYVGDYSTQLSITKTRVLAECDAKRRIVRDIDRLVRHFPDQASDWVLREMATPYASHPDYRREWRP